MPVTTFVLEIPLNNGDKQIITVVPPEGYEGSSPTIHRNDTFPIFGRLADGEEEFRALDGTVWHIDWRP